MKGEETQEKEKATKRKIEGKARGEEKDSGEMRKV